MKKVWSFLWGVVVHKLQKLLYFSVLALIVAFISLVARWLLEWGGEAPETARQRVAAAVDRLGPGMLGCIFLLGLVVMVKEEIDRRKQARQPMKPPPLPAHAAQPPGLPIGPSALGRSPREPVVTSNPFEVKTL